ncbi:hypothetical protein AAF712_015093 [Marasmius tenuissimus]|uniref:Protein kinase domain-containing protein n=1 Tax=Marasmius tenuissimus TaxID=585030 RepID=A0ABR2ZBC3_9AGAR
MYPWIPDIRDRAWTSLSSGTQINDQQSGSGAQNNTNSIGTQNITHWRDENLNNDPGGKSVNYEESWNSQPPPAYDSLNPSPGYGFGNNNKRENFSDGPGGKSVNNNSPPPTQHPFAESSTRERRKTARSLNITPPQRLPSGRRLDGDKLRREEDAFRNMRDNEDDYKEVLGIEGQDAQNILDDWQLLIECTEDTKLRQQVVRAMSELTYRSGRVPSTAPPQRPPIGRRLDSDMLRREEDAFRSMRNDEVEYEEILELKDEEAQELLDDWQLLIECTEDTKLRQQVVRAMSELTHRSGRVPSIAPPQRPPIGRRLDGDMLRREEDDFRSMRNDEVEYEEILELKDEDAQEMLDDWQLLIECTEDTKLRQQVVHAMSELTYRSGRVPEGIWIGEVEDLSKDAVEFGSFADIWTGTINETKVALKVVRYRIDHEQHERVIKAKEIAQGLVYLHSLNITHGDLKGYNVLIDDDQNARITDFGLSRAVDNENLVGLLNMSSRQGSVRWLAPELLKSGRSSASPSKSDIYAFGCVCYEIYAKCIPFEDVKDYGIIYAAVIQNERPQPPQNMGDKMRHLMVSCWMADPNSRPDAAKIVEQINRPGYSRSEPGRPKSSYRDRNKTYSALNDEDKPLPAGMLQGEIEAFHLQRSEYPGLSFDVLGDEDRPLTTEMLQREITAFNLQRSNAVEHGIVNTQGIFGASGNHGRNPVIIYDDTARQVSPYHPLTVINDYLLTSVSGWVTGVVNDAHLRPFRGRLLGLR